MKTLLFLALCLTLTVICRAQEGEAEEDGGAGGKGEWKKLHEAMCDPTKIDDAKITAMKGCRKGGDAHGKHAEMIKKMFDTCGKDGQDDVAKFANVKDAENQKSIMMKCSTNFRKCLKKERDAKKAEGGDKDHEHNGHGGGHGKKGGGHGGKGDKSKRDEIVTCIQKALGVD